MQDQPAPIPEEYEEIPEPPLYEQPPDFSQPDPEPKLIVPPGVRLLEQMSRVRLQSMPALWQRITISNTFMAQAERALYANDEDVMEALTEELRKL